jgi:hypothetical protein
MLTANVAWAGPVLEDAVNACTGINCAAMSIRGVHLAREPFLVQVYAAEGECLRLDVDVQSQDMALLLAGPTVNLAGVNDDRDFDGGDYRPLLVVDPVPATGWYTVVISYFDVGATVGKFTLKYGRYPGGNPNCPLLAASSSRSLERLDGNPSKAMATSDGATGNSRQDD